MNENYDNNQLPISIIKKMDFKQQPIYIKLYKNYMLFHKNDKLEFSEKDIYEEQSDEKTSKINRLEDEIYSINGNILTQEERILLEINNILRFINKNKNIISEDTYIETKNELNELKKLLKNTYSKEKQLIKYLKQRISILQASLGMPIKFFNNAMEIFYEQISISNPQNKKKK